MISLSLKSSSGCITTAESILIQAQSIEEFCANLNIGKTVVVTLSPQSRASLAAHYGLSLLATARKLKTYFAGLGVNAVFDSSFGRQFSLLESARELTAAKKGAGPRTLLSSACPGWICYAEKTHGEFVLPFISSTKSPQQIMGTLVKYHYAPRIGVAPDQLYHVAIMPCYDKKLEASRADFYNDILSTRDVDCVISTSELLDYLRSTSVPFAELPESSLDTA